MSDKTPAPIKVRRPQAPPTDEHQIPTDDPEDDSDAEFSPVEAAAVAEGKIPVPTATPAPARAVQARRYKDSITFETDLFRLKTTKMEKKIMLFDDAMGVPEDAFRQVDHEHFFHTRDSSGKEMEHCNAVGGHFHVMDVSWPHGKDYPPVVKCGPPMKFIAGKRGKKTIAPANDNGDIHKHEVVYEDSSVIRPRQVNKESTAFLNAEAAKHAKVEGIEG